MKPMASTGTRNAFPARMAMQAPRANSTREAMHTMGNFPSRPGCGQHRLGFRDLPAEEAAFFRLVVSLISARMLPGAAVSREKMLSLISAGEIPSTIKSPAIMPMQAISWIIVMQFPPFSG